MPFQLPSYLSPLDNPVSLLRHISSYNIRTLRSSPLSELSGSLGDLGTLLPLLLALVLTRSILLAPTLLFTGAANILTGLFFGIPLPVQPMKAIAAVAIAKSYGVEQTMASGLSMAIAVGILTVTGLLGGNEEAGDNKEDGSGKKRGWGLMRWVPVPVVKGIQMGAGLSLCLSAGEKMLVPLGWRGEWWGDNLVWAIAAALVVLASEVTAMRRGASRIPAALVIFLVGLILALIRLNTHPHASAYVESTSTASSHRFDHLPSWPRSSVFIDTLPTALGQLPLTALNSILAVTHLASDLYPSGFPTPPSPGGLGVSISIMNLFGCVFGAMPACHGSGGLAGQHKFGARSGASVVILGIVKMTLGVIAVAVSRGEQSMVRVLEVFPKGLLGVMVIAAGVELAKVGGTVNEGARDLWETADSADVNDEHIIQHAILVDGLREDADSDDGGEGHFNQRTVLVGDSVDVGDDHIIQNAVLLGGGRRRARALSESERKERVAVMLVTVATLLAFKNDGVGFVVGMVWHWGLRLPQAWRRWRAHRSHESGNDSDFDDERRGLLSS